MSAYVVWMDNEHAKIFEMTTEGVKNSTIKNHHHDHHRQNPRDHHPDHEKFYHEVADSIKNTSGFLLLGAGLGKDHFVNHLKNHHHTELSKKLLACETLDNVSDNQILAHARIFFKSANLYREIL